MSTPNKYDLRGVSADKAEVHEAIKNLDKGLYPNAFCKILPDLSAGNEDFINIMHADTAGTKTSLAYLYWKETGDLSVWKGIAQDAIVMNTDDMAAVGVINNILLSSTIGRNKHLIPGEIIKTIIHSALEFIENMASHGITILSAGGETADVGDIVRTIDVGYTTFARAPKSDLIINDIKPGNVIVGLASYGQSSYEQEYNSGIGSNGLTLARHDVLSNEYAEKYPETYAPDTPKEVVYTGKRKVTDLINVNGTDHHIGKLLLSPTRTFLPVLNAIVSEYRNKISGIIHNTGGSQTKVLHFTENVHIIKDNLLPIAPIFELIQQESQTEWKEMFKVLNCGTRLEIYTDSNTANDILAVANDYKIDAQIIGRVERKEGKASLEIQNEKGNFSY